MATLMTVRLDKGSSPNLGFRLQGGKDFGTPLVVQKVNGGSPAERAGLIAGDSVIKINNTDVFNLRHKDAQDVIVRAGPAFEVTVQRGGSVWKPTVIPTGPLPSTPSSLSPITKTSLAANKGSSVGSIGTGHNVSAKPFNTQLNGAVNGGPKLVNNQYNSPVKLYSEQSIAETLSAQTEVLSTGALGVNFKKNEKDYDATQSAVFRMLQEAENEPKSSEPGVAGLRHVVAPETKPTPPSPQLPPGQNICADCERLIVGVFVRIKDKNLHVECFKCSTCGTSLKNVGYYNINNKLYCDVHAKLAARSNPPAPNLVPVTVPPGSKAPVSAISSALATHSLPSPSPLSPKSNLAQPFQTGYSTTPRPFSSVSAPTSTPNFNTLPKAAPLSPVALAPAPSYSPVSSTGFSAHSFVWPPPPEEPEVPTACPLYVAPETHLKVTLKPPKEEEETDLDYCNFDECDIMAQYDQIPKLSLCSQEVCNINSRSSVECIETITESVETQQLVENVIQNNPQSFRPPSPTLPPIDQDITVKQSRKDESTCESYEICQNTQICQKAFKRLTDFTPNTVECTLKSQVENSIPQKWESQLVQALRIDPDDFSQIPKKTSTSQLASALAIAPAQPFTANSNQLEPVSLPEETVPYFPPEELFRVEIQDVKSDQSDKQSKTVSVKKKAIGKDDLLKDLPKPQKVISLRDALTTACDRPYSPFSTENVTTERKTTTTEEEKIDKQNLTKPLKPTALPQSFKATVVEKPQAPKPFPITVKEIIEEKTEEKQRDTKKSTTVEKHQTHNTIEETIETISGTEENTQGMYPFFKGFTCSFDSKSEHSNFSVEISTSPPIINLSRTQTPSVKISKIGQSTESVTENTSEQSHTQEKTSKIEKQAEEIVLKKPLPLTNILHKPDSLPQYQVNLQENAEADIKLMQRKEAAKVRMEQQKLETHTKPTITDPPKPIIKPIIKVESGVLKPEQSFKPVVENRPPSSTFSPRPRPLTPSMINKPPPILPYYQASLAVQEFKAPVVNLLDPATPNISRSPSPCPDYKSSSLFPTPSSVQRPKSPAAGPPPNILHTGLHLPSPGDSRKREATENIKSYIPQYQTKANIVQYQDQQQKLDKNKTCLTTGLKEIDHTKTIQYQEKLQSFDKKENCLLTASGQVKDVQAEQVRSANVSTSVLEESHVDDLEAVKKAQTCSLRCSADGLTQIQKKQIVTEEFERRQKAQIIQVEKSATSTTQHPFCSVKNPTIDAPGVLGMHVTNPQRIAKPFAKSDVQLNSPPPPPPPRALIKHVIAPSTSCPTKHVPAPSGSAQKPNHNVNKSNIPMPNTGTSAGRQTAAVGVAPKRGRGVLNAGALGGTRIPLCASCHSHIRGPFITALGKIWCPEHFVCATPSCRRPLQDLGFVEERGQLYCEYCFEQYLAPPCAKCHSKIKGDCLKAIGKEFHPECFNCVYCGKLFGNSPFFLEDGNPYCEADWNELFTTKCFACGFPVEAGDRWVEALNNNYHSQCFNCTMCKKNLEGQSFFAKGGRPFCKNHAR